MAQDISSLFDTWLHGGGSDDEKLDAIQRKIEGMQEAMTTSGNKDRESKENIAKKDRESREKIAEIEAKARKKLQEQQDRAAMERLTVEIQGRLQVVDKETAAQMARLEKELGVRREDMANQLLMAREQLGFKREELAVSVQQERDKLAFAREEMEKVGIPKMLADKWYQEQQVILAQSAQQIDREKVEIERGRLGLEVFNKGVELASNPASRFQFGDFATGIGQNAQARDWMAAMNDAFSGSGFGVAADAGTQAMTPQEAIAAMTNFLSNRPAANVSTAAAAPPMDINALGANLEAAVAAGQMTREDANARWQEGVMGTPDAASKTVQGADLGSDFGGGVMGTPDTFQVMGSPDAAQSAVSQQNRVINPYYGDVTGLSPAMQQYLQQQAGELDQIGKIADAGASALAPGTLERLGEDGLKEFVSGLQKLRRDSGAWLNNYAKTRVYQGGGPEQNWAA